MAKLGGDCSCHQIPRGLLRRERLYISINSAHPDLLLSFLSPRKGTYILSMECANACRSTTIFSLTSLCVILHVIYSSVDTSLSLERIIN